MSLDPERTPVILAVGQAVSRDNSLGPLELAEAAAAEALGAAPGLGGAIDTLTVVNMLSSRAGRAPASELAARLALRPLRAATTTVGGNVPQWLVTRAANEIRAGRCAAALVVGGESLRTARLRSRSAAHEARAAGADLGVPDPVLGTDRQDLADEERAAGLSIPLFVYPLFESVLASRAGRDPLAQREYLGGLLAPLTSVASCGAYSWFPEARSPAALAAPSTDNRLVVEPYTKRMVAFLGAAQGAAVIVASLAVARRFGLAAEAVFVWSGARCDEVWYPIARPDLGRSAGVAAAGRAVLGAGGVGIDDVELLDIYSCFPSALQIGAAALGIAPDDSRALTVTGGLPYFGGPGSDYATHAIAEMVTKLRSSGVVPGRDRRLGLVTAVGWYLTKHAVGLYGSEPPPSGYLPGDTGADQERIDASALAFAVLGESFQQEATVEASTVIYDRLGNPVGAPVIATLRDGRRVAAAAQLDELASLAGRWLVGARIAVGQLGDGTAARYRVITA